MLKGTLEGHSGWVTSLATSPEKYAEHRVNLGGEIRRMWADSQVTVPTCSSLPVATKR